jgi:hypothetical protein
MQRRKITKITKITPKMDTNKKINNLSRFVTPQRNVTYTFLILCDYCDYSITDSDFNCDFSCDGYVTDVTFLSDREGVIT